MPNGLYSGQKLMRLVNTKTPTKIKRTIPNVPVTVPVKYKTPKIAVIITRVIRSVVFIFLKFNLFLYCNTKLGIVKNLKSDLCHHSSIIFNSCQIFSIFPSFSIFLRTLLMHSSAVNFFCAQSNNEGSEFSGRN